MPRKPIGDQAMTAAERQRGWRERLQQARTALDTSVLDVRAAKQKYDALCEAVRGETDDEARERLARGARQTRAARLAWVRDHPGHTAADYDHWGSCSATPEQERHWQEWIVTFFAQYREVEPGAQELAEVQELADALAEIDRLRQRVSDLETERVAKPTPPPSDGGDNPRIARLEKLNRELRGKLRDMHQFYEEQSRDKGVMSFATYSKVMRCLHPDQPPPTPEQRQEACGLFSQWKQDRDSGTTPSELAGSDTRHRNG